MKIRSADPTKASFLLGVFLIAGSVLVFQIVQTRILSVIAWYYLAFFAISVAMLGLTIGAVWVYLHPARCKPDKLASTLVDCSLICAIAMPLSLIVQFTLVTSVTPTVSTLASWSILLTAMATPYLFAGIVLSLALTRSPYPVSQVYGADLFGAASGCVAVVFVLGVLDAPSTIILAGAAAGLAAYFFASGAGESQRQRIDSRPWWMRPGSVAAGLILLTAINQITPFGVRPIQVKDHLEGHRWYYEKWNSYSRVTAAAPRDGAPKLWAPSPKMPREQWVRLSILNIDGAAGTVMFHYDGTRESLEFLRYDLVNLAYCLPDIREAAVIGVGGGRDVLSAHLHGISKITGVELNPIFIDLLTREPSFKRFSNLSSLPDLRLVVDDARSWFARTEAKFDLVQMSMIDTWAATGAGAFTLSENGLYTLEGWRTFLEKLDDDGIFTVSRWYHPDNINESGRMISLAAAALLDAGAEEPRRHIFVARAKNIATLVLSKSPFRSQQLRLLHERVTDLGFGVLLAPDRPPESRLLASILEARDIEGLNRVGGDTFLDLTVPTDDRPFFFNQLRFSRIPGLLRRMRVDGDWAGGVIRGNLLASTTLSLILFISLLAVVCTILVPLRRTAASASRNLVVAGTAYFSLIGTGFMMAEIGLLQSFSIYLGHPIYSLTVCLSSLIVATGAGSLASGRASITTPGRVVVWGLMIGIYLLGVQHWLTDIFHDTAHLELGFRIGIALLIIMPLGFLLGFAFPSGMRFVEVVDRGPTPWFWGVNGATGVMASVLAVILSISFGIRATLVASAICYLGLIPAATALMAVGRAKSAEADVYAVEAKGFAE